MRRQNNDPKLKTKMTQQVTKTLNKQVSKKVSKHQWLRVYTAGCIITVRFGSIQVEILRPMQKQANGYYMASSFAAAHG